MWMRCGKAAASQMAGKWRLKTMDHQRFPRASWLYNTGVSLVSTRWLSKLTQVFPRSTLFENLFTLLVDAPLARHRQ